MIHPMSSYHFRFLKKFFKPLTRLPLWGVVASKEGQRGSQLAFVTAHRQPNQQKRIIFLNSRFLHLPVPHVLSPGSYLHPHLLMWQYTRRSEPSKKGEARSTPRWPRLSSNTWQPPKSGPLPAGKSKKKTTTTKTDVDAF